jgi:glucans biosynthesis protein C
VLPFYVLHEPVIVAIAFWLVRWDVGIVPKYLALVLASFTGTLALYEFGVRRTRITRFLFGMKPPRDRRGLTDATVTLATQRGGASDE